MLKQNRNFILVIIGWLLFIILAALLSSCSAVTEEHIRASSDSIEFSRTAGRKVATGGFSLTKDSLIMQGVH